MSTSSLGMTVREERALRRRLAEDFETAKAAVYAALEMMHAREVPHAMHETNVFALADYALMAGSLSNAIRTLTRAQRSAEVAADAIYEGRDVARQAGVK